MSFFGPMFAVLAWMVLALQAGGLVLRNHSDAKALHQESEETKAKDKRLHSCLSGKRIVFIGPSTSKMDYLALAFFAEYGWWPNEELVFFGRGEWGPNPLNEGGVPNYGALPPPVVTPLPVAGCMQAGQQETYMRYSNYLFNGKEICDCYEFGAWAGPVDANNSTENRIYTNGDTMIAYYQWFGDIVPPRGTFDISPLLKDPPQKPVQTCPVGQFPGKWAWSFTMKDFLANIISLHKPTHLVLSTAFWPVNPADTQFWDGIAEAGVHAVMDSGGEVIWRTTPQRTDHTFAHVSPRVNMTPFVKRGWQLFPAQQLIHTFQGMQHNDAVFYDFAHLRPQSQCYLTQKFLQTHVCPGQI